MLINFVAGKIIYHHWGKNHHLVESSKPFHSLDELLAHCLTPPANHLVDRVLIISQDAQKHQRQLVLGFQSLTEPE